MTMKRRDFLTQTAMGVGGLMLGAQLRSVAAPGKHDPYEVVELGKTGIKVSKLGLGTGMKGYNRESNHTRMGQEKFEGLLRTSYEHGIRLIDVADLYGTHPYILPAFKKYPRESYTIVSKIWYRPNGLPEEARPPATETVERFLKELNTDYIDLVLLHCVTEPDWRTKLSDRMDDLAGLKKRGLIRAHGCSFHTLEALSAATEEPWVDSVHARINPYAVKMDVKKPEEVPKVANVLKTLRSQGKGVVGMKIIGEGQFGDNEEKRDTSIAYAFNSGCVDTMIVGFEKETEIDDFERRAKAAPVEKMEAAAKA
ncbi:MAG: aldo/keto reductase [Candidatus Hydrogenedentota bacterium]